MCVCVYIIMFYAAFEPNAVAGAGPKFVFVIVKFCARTICNEWHPYGKLLFDLQYATFCSSNAWLVLPAAAAAADPTPARLFPSAGRRCSAKVVGCCLLVVGCRLSVAGWLLAVVSIWFKLRKMRVIAGTDDWLSPCPPTRRLSGGRALFSCSCCPT